MCGCMEDEGVSSSRITPSTETTIELARCVRMSYFGIVEPSQTCVLPTPGESLMKKESGKFQKPWHFAWKLLAPSPVVDSRGDGGAAFWWPG